MFLIKFVLFLKIKRKISIYVSKTSLTDKLLIKKDPILKMLRTYQKTCKFLTKTKGCLSIHIKRIHMKKKSSTLRLYRRWYCGRYLDDCDLDVKTILSFSYIELVAKRGYVRWNKVTLWAALTVPSRGKLKCAGGTA